MAELMNLLAQHGVQAVTQLKPEQFADVGAIVPQPRDMKNNSPTEPVYTPRRVL